MMVVMVVFFQEPTARLTLFSLIMVVPFVRWEDYGTRECRIMFPQGVLALEPREETFLPVSLSLSL